MMSHEIQQCKHGVLYSQCRCPGPNKTMRIVSCAWTKCNVHESLTDEEITQLAYEEIFNSAQSMLEDWIDEDGQYSPEDFEKIYSRSFELLKELKEKYL